jgi:hypothetical protein
VSEELQLSFPAFEAPPTATAQPTAAPPPATGDERAFRVEVTRSAKRRRTVGARLVGGVLRITIPARLTRAEEDRWVREMTRRFERMRSTERVDLARRARELARRHGLPAPADIRWSDDMTARWGSCTPATRTIRVSTRTATFPDWVVDYVIVHELAHLRVAGHSDDFWALVNTYPRTERAIGYLIAKSGDID